MKELSWLTTLFDSRSHCARPTSQYDVHDVHVPIHVMNFLILVLFLIFFSRIIGPACAGSARPAATALFMYLNTALIVVVRIISISYHCHLIVLRSTKILQKCSLQRRCEIGFTPIIQMSIFSKFKVHNIGNKKT